VIGVAFRSARVIMSCICLLNILSEKSGNRKGHFEQKAPDTAFHAFFEFLPVVLVCTTLLFSTQNADISVFSQYLVNSISVAAMLRMRLIYLHLSKIIPPAHWARGMSSLAVDAILKCLACLEGGNGRGRNLHRLFRLRIQASPCAALLRLKGSKANQLHLIAGGDGSNDGIQNTIQGGSRLLLVQLGLFGILWIKSCLFIEHLIR
jgi:hypothetical protein